MTQKNDQQEEAFQLFVVNELGLHALANDKMSTYEVAQKAWNAALSAQAQEPTAAADGAGLAQDIEAALKAVVAGTLDTGPLVDIAATARAIAEKHRSTPTAAIQPQEGMVLVPVEPTEAMLDAGRAQDFENDIYAKDDNNPPMRREDAARAIYRAMLAAAPNTPEGIGAHKEAGTI